VGRPVFGAQQRRQLPDERRKAAIGATLRLLSTLPHDQILVEDIAVAAGMSRPLIYHYFGGKDQVVAAALRWYGHQLLTDVMTAASAAGPRWLAAGVHSYLDYVVGQTSRFATLVRYTRVPGTQMHSVLQEIRTRISLALYLKLAPASESPLLRLLTSGWIGQVESICQEWSTRRDPAREELEQLLCELLVSAVRAGAQVDTRMAGSLRLLAAD
jgi:AcrR family transcriptional regulator